MTATNGTAPLHLESVSARSFIVKGDTKTHKDLLKSLGGRWWPRLEGWGFRIAQEKHVRAALGKLLGARAPVVQDAPPAAPKPSSNGHAKPAVKPGTDSAYIRSVVQEELAACEIELADSEIQRVKRAVLCELAKENLDSVKINRAELLKCAQALIAQLQGEKP